MIKHLWFINEWELKTLRNMSVLKYNLLAWFEKGREIYEMYDFPLDGGTRSEMSEAEVVWMQWPITKRRKTD